MKPYFRIAATLACPCSLVLPTVAQNQIWSRQLGSNTTDVASVAAPAGSSGAYFGGTTFGSLGGPSAGGGDAWLARYDSAGAQGWIVQFGSSGNEVVLAAAPHANDGVYIGGFTDGSFGATNAGGSDAWLASYDGAGNQTWVRQFGTSAADTTWAAAGDGSGGVFACGDTYGSFAATNAGSNDAILARYDDAGNELWKRQIGTPTLDAAFAAATDATGGLYVAGGTDGGLGGSSSGGMDVWLARYDGAGNQLWIRQLGTSGIEFPQAASSDGGGGVYLSGLTNRNLGGTNAGNTDAWLARYDAAGNRLWVRQLGTSSDEYASAVVSRGLGQVYVTGFTDGDLGGPSAGGADAWLASFDAAGNQTWLEQFGSSHLDYVHAVTMDGASGVYVGGTTYGDLGGPNAGAEDAWVVRYSAPAPTTFCTSGTTTHGCSASIGATGTPSASAASGFVVTLSSVEGQRQGLIFYGIDNSGFTPLPWGPSTSYMCVKSPAQRTPGQNSGGTLNQCDGSLSLDWNAFRAANPSALGQPFSAGQHVFAQGWFRDPASPKSTMLSNGLEFVVQP